jgi:hypothetical protein
MFTSPRFVLAFAGAAAVAGALAATGGADAPDLGGITSVAAPNTKVAGIVRPDVLSPQLAQIPVAQGATPLENGTATTPFYGYLGNGPHVPAPGTTTEAQKTEPDKNTYLVLHGQHYLFQGHEAGTPGAITRINLDADAAHRVTLLATTDDHGAALPQFDGSTWDPFAQRLLFTAEKGNAGGVWQATLGVPSTVQDISGEIGRGGYESIQNDSDGNVWIVEDVGGAKGTVNSHARQPNSFVYRFVPADPTDLTQGGRLQALQVLSNAPGRAPIEFHAGQADADIQSADTAALYSYGETFQTHWVTIHTSGPGGAPFDANAAAKAAHATPFKRPENGQFRPGSHFGEYFFDATGDTDANTEAGSAHGGFGGVFRLRQRGPSADGGTLSLFYQGDKAHTGLDNVSWLSSDIVTFVEDAGDGLHTQRNALDSGYLFDADVDYGAAGAPEPVRWVAQGRDPSATIDSALLGSPGFTNDGDNEITGTHVSDGDPSVHGLLGAKIPHLFEGDDSRWRFFYTRQHGDNVTFEVVRNG